MDLIAAAILGLVQGITEFFPVSSSGHLLLLPVISDKLNTGLNFNFQDKNFDIMLHVATFLVILLFYRVRIWGILRNWRQSKFLIRNLILTSIPAIIVGGIIYLLGDAPDWLVVVNLIIVGLMLIYVDLNNWGGKLTADQLGTKSALIIGAFQSLALLRGVSRSGITLIGGLTQGLKRKDALEYAFLSSIPVFTVLTLAEIALLVLKPGSQTASAPQLVVGFIVAFASALVAVKIFSKYINKRGVLAGFGVYRVILGIILLCLGFL